MPTWHVVFDKVMSEPYFTLQVSYTQSVEVLEGAVLLVTIKHLSLKPTSENPVTTITRSKKHVLKTQMYVGRSVAISYG